MKIGLVSGVAVISILSVAQSDASLVITTDTVQNGGTLTINPADELVIHGPTNPLLTMTNGANSSGVRAILVGAAALGDGRLRVEENSFLTTTSTSGTVGTYGGIDAFSSEGYLGFNQNTTGSAIVTGSISRLRIRGTFYVGHYGTGELSIQDFADVESNGAVIGNAVGSVGLVSIGPNQFNGSTMWNSGSMTVALNGEGTVNVGAYSRLDNSDCTVGQNANSIGNVTVSGPGAQWTTSDLSVGMAGEGHVRVADRGNVLTGGTLAIGDQPGGHGEVTVSDEETFWQAIGDIVVGNEGSGTLVIENHAVVDTVSHVTIGKFGTGVAIVRGKDSVFDVDGHFVVGDHSPGYLTIEDGAVVNSFLGRVSASSNATAMIDGIDSIWDIHTILTVANTGGTGNLLVKNEGTIAVADMTLIGAGATITIDHAHFVDELGGDAERIDGQGEINVINNSNVGFESITGPEVSVGNSSILRISAGGGNLGTSRVQSIQLSNGGRFDLTDHGLIVANGNPSAVRQQIANAFNAGAWNGPNGIGSSLANHNGKGIGYATYTEIGSPGLFLGEPALATDVFVRYTLMGDTDLNGVVNFDDLLRVAHNYGVMSNQVWFTGDFTYDNAVNFNDLLPIAQNYGMTLLTDGNVLMDESMQMRFESDWQLALTSVPEPVLGSLLMGSLILLRRRIRGR